MGPSDIPPLGRVGVLSTGIFGIPDLRALLGADRLVFRPGRLREVDCVVGWGRRPSAEPARAFARTRGLPFYALEDGFLRSVATGAAGDPPLSIVIDDEGVHYDATRRSRLESMLASDTVFPAEELARARRAMRAIHDARLSKYNHAPALDLGPRERARVLVIDQTVGDAAISFGGADATTFPRMLEAARHEHPDAEIVVKTHPEVSQGDKRGHFAIRKSDPRVRWIDQLASPIDLLAQVDHAYVASSLLGFEALCMGKPVTCFGAPFYAGWGLTEDRAPIPPRRGRARSIDELFAASYLRYARYLDPETRARGELEHVIDHLALQRELGERTRGRFVCVGFSLWKRGFVPRFLSGPGAEVDFVRDASAAERRGLDAGTSLVAWGTREEPALRALSERTGAPLWRMEDGFLRSVGLGSDLHVPASLVLDAEGVHYDPARPSALEQILERATFSPAELARARSLRERIVLSGISKYNVGARGARVAARAGNREVVLVIGQVEDDASVRLGCIDVRSNLRLLEEARRARPLAWIVWRPHPDVLSGNRLGAVSRERALAYANELAEDASIAACLAPASEVHTMTSLVGFEALLRGKRVVAYGQPFYSGWGLTEDRHPVSRRTRRLSLDELVAGTLLRYPRYVSPTTGRYTTPEAVVDALVRERERAPATPWRASWAMRSARKVRLLAEGALLGRSASSLFRMRRRRAP